jgi:predicted nucleic acid-binding protein
VSYLLDTNILRELRKPEPKRNAGLNVWLSAVKQDELYLSVLVVGEIRKGIEQLRGRDPDQALALNTWLGRIESFYADRILPITLAIAQRWGQSQAARNYPVIDSLVAATADEHELCLVSRNLADLQGWPAVRPPLNPFSG